MTRTEEQRRTPPPYTTSCYQDISSLLPFPTTTFDQTTSTNDLTSDLTSLSDYSFRTTGIKGAYFPFELAPSLASPTTARVLKTSVHLVKENTRAFFSTSYSVINLSCCSCFPTTIILALKTVLPFLLTSFILASPIMLDEYLTS